MIYRGKLLAWAAFVLLFASVSYAVNLMSNTPKDVLYTWGAAVSGVVQYALVLGLMLLIARPEGKRLFALRRPTSWRLAAGLAVGILLGVFALAAALEPFLNPGREQNLLPDRWEPTHAAAFAANFVVVAVLAPVVEELTFRGLGYSLLAPLGRWWAILLVGLAFGVAHGLVQGLPLLFAIGSGLAYLRSRTKSVYPTMLVHGVFNGLVLAAAVTT